MTGLFSFLSRLPSDIKNRQHIEHILKDCEIPHTGYKMDMAEEKLMGKARNKTHIVTAKEAFAYLEYIIPTRNNAFLFRK